MNQKGFSPLIIILGIILVIGITGGVYYFGTLKNTQPQSQNPIVTSQSPQPPVSSTHDPTANWKTYTRIGGDFTMKYPPNFYTSKVAVYEGGGDEIYIADSENTIKQWQQSINLTDQNILIQPIELSLGGLGDINGHTKDEIVEKLANRLGTSKYVDGSVTVPWVNENGGTIDGSKNFYTSSFSKLTVDGKLAARVTTKDSIDYIILLDNNSYLRISASPANSIFIGDFDRMISTFKFTR